MNKYYGVILLCIFFLISSSLVFSQDCDFKINRIKDKEGTYLIEAERNDSLFNILAISYDPLLKTKKIGRSGKYKLVLKKVFPLPNQMNILDIHSFVYHGFVIRNDEKHHHSVYVAQNLNGLYLTE